MAKPKYEKWLTENGLLQLEAWARNGLSREEIAHNMGINRKTLTEWEKKYPPIGNALSRAREVADIIVENALYKKCIGYNATVKKLHKLRRVEYDPETGRKTREYDELVEGIEEVHVPADTTAQKYWLGNRKPDTWKDKQITEEKVDTEVTVHLEGGANDYAV